MEFKSNQNLFNEYKSDKTDACKEKRQKTAKIEGEYLATCNNQYILKKKKKKV